jgi:hypothetical protein
MKAVSFGTQSNGKVKFKTTQYRFDRSQGELLLLHQIQSMIYVYSKNINAKKQGDHLIPRREGIAT